MKRLFPLQPFKRATGGQYFLRRVRRKVGYSWKRLRLHVAMFIILLCHLRAVLQFPAKCNAPHTHTVWPSVRPSQLKTERQN
jgi:hypothetical protein